jgi:hypothetical protein
MRFKSLFNKLFERRQKKKEEHPTTLSKENR